MIRAALPCAVLSAAILFLGCGQGKPTAAPRAAAAPTVAGQSPEAIKAEVRKQVAEVLGLEPEKLDPAVPLMNEAIGADDLDMVEVLMAVEDAFDITIPDEEIGKALKPIEEITVNELARYVGVQLKAKKGGK